MTHAQVIAQIANHAGPPPSQIETIRGWLKEKKETLRLLMSANHVDRKRKGDAHAGGRIAARNKQITEVSAEIRKLDAIISQAA